jgi:hypothetical protein
LWIALPGAIVAGAALGALVEWQNPDLIDIGDIVRAVEKEFGIKIPEQEWQAIETVDDRQACVVRQLPVESGTRPTESDEGRILSRIKSSTARGIGNRYIARQATFACLPLIIRRSTTSLSSY